MNKPRIILTGPSGTGKTTLAKALSDHYEIPYIVGSAGKLFNPEQINTLKMATNNLWGPDTGHLNVLKCSAIYPDFNFLFQAYALQQRAAIIREATQAGKGFVTDRGLSDCLAYMSMSSWNLNPKAIADYLAEFLKLLRDPELLPTSLLVINRIPHNNVENNDSRIPIPIYQDACQGVFDNIILHYMRRENTKYEGRIHPIHIWEWQRRLMLAIAMVDSNLSNDGYKIQ